MVDTREAYDPATTAPRTGFQGVRGSPHCWSFHTKTNKTISFFRSLHCWLAIFTVKLLALPLASPMNALQCSFNSGICSYFFLQLNFAKQLVIYTYW